MASIKPVFFLTIFCTLTIATLYAFETQGSDSDGNQQLQREQAEHERRKNLQIIQTKSLNDETHEERRQVQDDDDDESQNDEPGTQSQQSEDDDESQDVQNDEEQFDEQ